MLDFERAARFIYLQRAAFGGKVIGQNFGISLERKARFDLLNLIPHIEDMHFRLQSVITECLPYENFIRRYDKESTLFYLDPPYWDCEDMYGKNIFEKTDFNNLAKVLKGIKGKFIMSLNDVPEVRKIFKGFHIKDVKTKYSVQSGKSKDVAELLISNVDLNKL